MKLKTNKGFTLIEVLLVIGIIAILASIVIIAINPLRQLAAARNAQRAMNINAIHKALLQYTVAHGSLPTTMVGTSSMEICRSNATDCTGLLDLSVLSNNAEYMTALPIDPSVSSLNGTGYMAYKTVAGRPVVYAPLAELGEIINTSNNSSNVKCTPDCTGKCGGSDGCGETCPNSCSGGTPYCVSDTCSATRPTPCSDTAAAAVECNSSSAYGAICGGGYLVCKSGDNECGNINLVAAPSGCTVDTNNTATAVATACNSCGADANGRLWDSTASPSQLNLNDAVDGRLNFSDGADGASYPAKNNTNANYAAAKYCLNLSITVGGQTYSDWYLPAAKELATIIKSGQPFYSDSNKQASNAYYGEGTTNNGTLVSLKTGDHYNATPLITASADFRVSGLASAYYWSSTEYDAATAWYQNTNDGYQNSRNKTMMSTYVRCVRRF